MNETEYTAGGIAVEYTERETLLMKDMSPTTQGFYRFLKEVGAERDEALARAEALKHDVRLLHLELHNVLALHKHDGPSSMQSRIQATLLATTPDPIEAEERTT